MLATAQELAKELRCCPTTVIRMFQDGRIPEKYVMKIGGDYRFNKKEIIAYLFSQHTSPPKNP